MTDDTNELLAADRETQRIADQRMERRQIAEALVEGVPLDRLRAIQQAGGLAKLLEAFDGLLVQADWDACAFRDAALKMREMEFEARKRMEAAEPFEDRED